MFYVNYSAMAFSITTSSLISTVFLGFFLKPDNFTATAVKPTSNTNVLKILVKTENAEYSKNFEDKPLTKFVIKAKKLVMKEAKKIIAKIATGTKIRTFKNLGVSFLVKNKIVSQSATANIKKYTNILDKSEITCTIFIRK